MKISVVTLIITCLLSSLTPAFSQDATKAMESKPIWLKLNKLPNEGKFLGKNKDDYATMDKEPGNYIFWSTLGGDPAKQLQNGQTYKIQLNDMFLYCTAKGNAGLYKTANDDASSWKIEKLKQQSSIKDDLIRHGDVIRLSNGHWKTSYLYDDGTVYAAAGDYPDKPREWVVDWELTKVQREKMPMNNEIIHEVVYIDNSRGASAPGTKITITLSAEDEVGVSNINSNDWSSSLSVTASAGGKIKVVDVSLSTTATVAYGGEVREEKNRVQKMAHSKSIETTYDKPAYAEVFLLTRLSVPYQNFVLSYEGAEPINLRSINGGVTLTSIEAIYLPSYNKSGEIVALPEADVMDALDKFNRTDPVRAEEVRKKRLPIWKKNGWIAEAKPALVLAPDSEMKVEQKYWSENKEFYANFQPDGNFVIRTKDDGYKWDIFTKGNFPAGAKKADLGAEKLILQPDGNLVFYGPSDAYIWGTDQLLAPVANSTLNLSNSGNLLLLGPDGAVLWDSSK